MKIGSRLIQFPIHHPKLITALLVLFTLATGSLISLVHVDTDPENMLAEDEAVRVYHNLVKKEFTLYDMVVLGVVNEKHPDGVFNPQTLEHVQELTKFAATLSHPSDPTKRVVGRDIIAPGNVDTIKQAGPGQVSFEWLMSQVPETREEALEIRESAMGNHLLKGTLVSEDGKAIGIYIPITSKDFAHFVRKKLLEKIDSFNDGDDKFFITGLPVAEDTFGKEMFVQMAISAPLAMLAIFVLMLLFFKKISLIISPMIVAMISVISTMGLLIGTGNTLHIMSSMIPIFLMPIAVVDSIHILSEFFDKYQEIKDRRKTIEHVLDQLFMPMLYTSLTSSAGFASLALTPIPPVQAFGIFVAFGIMFAWFVTIIFIPAYVMMMGEKTLENFGAPAQNSAQNSSLLSSFLRGTGRFTYAQSKFILIITTGILFLSFWGISKIQVNDNPIKWFSKDHEIRVADRVLNSHFGGTYEAYLVLEAQEEELSPSQTAEIIMKSLSAEPEDKDAEAILKQAKEILVRTSLSAKNRDALLQQVEEEWLAKQDESNDAEYDIWIDLIDKLDAVKNRDQIFKNPEMLHYIDTLQQHMNASGVVGKSNSVTDVVKKVHQELFEGKNEFYSVPNTINGVAQCLISFQNSHKPDDLWHFVTPDYKKANIWVQLKNGDNQVMEALVKEIETFMAATPPPFKVEQKWAGLTFLNVVWQDKMVTGMQEAFLSSFIVVFVMMVILFRSLIWGLLAMIPLSVTITLIYGIIGFIGKDYDMPVAVLSSLTLGLAIDFAIHFLERSRTEYRNTGSWAKAIKGMFEEPARAISRNVIVIAIGFTPLLAAPLVPYKTVGIFLASIMAISGIGTMIILPASITFLQGPLFRRLGKL